MRNVNTLSQKRYCILSIVSLIFGMVVYRPTVFRCLLFMSYYESLGCLCIICGICFSVTFLLTFKNRRNYFSVVTNSVLPFGIYTLIAYDDSHPTVISVIGIAVMVISALFCFAVILRKIKPDNIAEILAVVGRRLRHCLVGVKCIAAIGFSVFIGYLYILNVFGVPSLVPAVETVKTVEKNKQEILEKNMPVISSIDDSEWDKLSSEERLNVLQTLANVEKAQQGITHEVLVCAEPLGFSTYGYYVHSTHTVTINSNIINNDTAEKSVQTLCHEIRHAYQHDVADAFLSLDKQYQQLGIFDEVRAYYENLDDYKNVSEDGFDEYESQTVEVDSRAYSEEQAEFYFEQVKIYLANEARATED